MRRKFLILLWILGFALYGCGNETLDNTLYSLLPAPEAEVPPEIQDMLWSDNAELRAHQQAYYTRYIDAGGIAIIGSRLVDDEILMMARDVVLEMTAKRPELRESLSAATGHYQILVNGRFEDVDDIPEYRLHPVLKSQEKSSCQADYCVSEYYDHPYPPGNSRSNRVSGILEVFVHEFAHAIHGVIKGQPQWAVDWFDWDPRLTTLDPTFDERLQQAYENAVELGIWSEYFGGYMETNHHEYWAVGVEMWFYHITDTPHPSRANITFRSYAEFAERDPLLVVLLQEWFREASFLGKY